MSGRALYMICLALTGNRPPLLADRYACSITRKAALRMVMELDRVNAYSRRDRLIRCLRLSDFASRVYGAVTLVSAFLSRKLKSLLSLIVCFSRSRSFVRPLLTLPDS